MRLGYVQWCNDAIPAKVSRQRICHPGMNHATWVAKQEAAPYTFPKLFFRRMPDVQYPYFSRPHL
jgi:hypothetical protein